MASFTEIYRLSEFVGRAADAGVGCDAWKDNVFANLLYYVDFYPILLMGSSLTTPWIYWDLFFLAVSVAVFLSAIDNYFWASVVFEEYGPQGCDCYYMYQMPAYASQLLFLFMSLYILLMLYRCYRPSWYSVAYIQFYAFMILFNRIYRNANEPYQLYFGALLGVAEAIVSFLVFWYVMRAWGHGIEESRIVRWLGLSNHFFIYDRPNDSSKAPKPLVHTREPLDPVHGFLVATTTAPVGPIAEKTVSLHAERLD